MSSKMDALEPPKDFRLRNATLEDIPQIRLLIDVSVRTLHTPFYTPAQIDHALISVNQNILPQNSLSSALESREYLESSVYGVDTQLIIDGTYFVAESTPLPSTMIACGGWSYRSTLYGGDQFNARSDNRLNPATDAAKIRAFFVHPNWTRKGVGGVVLRACEDAANGWGFGRAEMGATLNGVPFYASKGYVEVGDGVSMQPVGDGVLLELVRMTKIL